MKVDSDNPSGADNQQETHEGILRDCTPGTVDVVRHLRLVDGKGTVRPPWRHGELGRNDLALSILFDLFLSNDGESNNVPKVGILQRQEDAAPRVGDDTVRSRLYAGKPGGSTTTRHL